MFKLFIRFSIIASIPYVLFWIFKDLFLCIVLFFLFFMLGFEFGSFLNSHSLGFRLIFRILFWLIISLILFNLLIQVFNFYILLTLSVLFVSLGFILRNKSLNNIKFLLDNTGLQKCLIILINRFPSSSSVRSV